MYEFFFKLERSKIYPYTKRKIIVCKLAVHRRAFLCSVFISCARQEHTHGRDEERQWVHVSPNQIKCNELNICLAQSNQCNGLNVRLAQSNQIIAIDACLAQSNHWNELNVCPPNQIKCDGCMSRPIKSMQCMFVSPNQNNTMNLCLA